MINAPPFAGAPIFFLIASKNARVVDAYAARLKQDAGMDPVSPPKFSGRFQLTDNHPALYVAQIFVFAPLSGLLLAGSLWLACRTGAAVKRHAGPAADSYATFFVLLGAAYAMLESYLILKTGRHFPSPALGMIVALTMFLAGSVTANLLWIRHGMRPNRGSGLWMCTLAAGGICLAATLPITQVSGTVLSLLAGVAAGWFWPVGLTAVPPGQRHFAYALDGLGAILGTLAFQALFLLFGFYHVAALIFAILIAATTLFQKTNRPETAEPPALNAS